MLFLFQLKAAVRLALRDHFWRAVHSVRQPDSVRIALQSHIDSIRDIFPEVRFKRAKLILSGLDHIVVVLDDSWIFRFPRSEAYRTNLAREIAILRELKNKTPVVLPDYRYIAPSNAFGGYAMVVGRGLQPELFHSLSRDMQRSLVQQISRFLSTLHALPTSILNGPDGMGHEWTEDQRFSSGDFENRARVLSTALDRSSLDTLERFFCTYGKSSQARKRVVHTDLNQDNILLSRRGGHIGIIDFSDAALGDPAWDFAAIGSYDDWVCPFMIENYAFAAEDVDLLDRSRQQAVRYWSDRLYNRIQGIHANGSIVSIVAMLRSSLKRVSV